MIPRIMSEYAHGVTGIDIHPGASILGGDTTIEENVVVGGNTFVTKSIEKGTRVSAKEQELSLKINTI